jgi:endonuclease/exonuclease/phosphatase family metal-dependent hydrolase
MIGRSKLAVVAMAVTILAIAAAAVLLRDQLRCAGFAGPGITPGDLPEHRVEDGHLRIVTWNVRNFPLDERPQTDDLPYSRRTNICDFEEVVRGLDGDLLGLQEVNDRRRFPPILRRASRDRAMEVRISAGGGRFGQHLAIAWDSKVLELIGEPIEIPELALDPALRPGFAGYFRSRRVGGLDFTFVTVHHAAAVEGFASRRRQNRVLADWIAAWVDEVGDPDVIVAGDFNTAGSPRGGLTGDLQSLDALLGPAGFERLLNSTGCSQYWEGGERDGVQVPSLLDHVLLRGFGPETVIDPVRAWLHCARFECRELTSRPGAEDGTFWDVSDHCPLTLELRDGPRADQVASP